MYKNLNDVYRERIIHNEDLDQLNDWELLYLFDIIIGDMYKLFVFQEKKNQASIIEQKYNLIKKKLLSSESLLKKAIRSTHIFYDMELINKSILMEDLSENGGANFLLSKNRLNLLDQISYSFRYDLGYFVDVYIDFLEKNPNENRLIVDYIADGINELKIINYEKYEKFILEFFRCYYKCSLSNKDLSTAFINSLQIKSLREMYDEVSKDNGLLTMILQNYLEYETSNNEEKIKIDSNFTNNSSEVMVKKLKFKKES